MDFKIVWTQPALDNLQGIITYLLQYNPDYAHKTGQQILDKIDLLQEFPFLGIAYPLTNDMEVREISCFPYRIFYRIKPTADAVEILTIWHGARRESEIQVFE